MRVFRKRQLRLREANNGTQLRIHIDPNNINQGKNEVQTFAKTTGYPTRMEVQSGSSDGTKTVVDTSGNDSNTVPNAQRAMEDGYGYSKGYDNNGNPVRESNPVGESRFSGDLIEGAVMFSKKELRDFLKRI